MLLTDRNFNTTLLRSAGGGDPLIVSTPFLVSSCHPEVYILILPGFGIISHVMATFSSKTNLWIVLVWSMLLLSIAEFLDLLFGL